MIRLILWIDGWNVLDTYRGKRGLFGWLVLKWDVYMLKRFVLTMRMIERAEKMR